MGISQSLIEEDVGLKDSVISNPEERILYSTDYQTWVEEGSENLGFTSSCVEYHTKEDHPYCSHQCYMIEMTGTRRRKVAFKKDLSCYTAELETTHAGLHNIHLRQLITGAVTVIPIEQSAARDLDYMVNPILTVLAYHCDTVVMAVHDRTKNIFKAILFCDASKKVSFGTFSIPITYKNLAGVSVSCCSSVDGSNFVIFVKEDHYDEFSLFMYALRFENGEPVVRNVISSGHSSWYEPNIHTSYLGSSNDILVTFGDYPLGLAYSDPCRYIVTYDISKERVIKCVSLEHNRYPISLTCSSNSQWIGTLSRDPASKGGDAEGYIVHLYTAESLSLIIEISIPLDFDNFNTLSHCNKVMFSRNYTLLAVASSDTRDEFGADFYGYCGGLSKKGTKGVLVNVYRLPVIKLKLKSLCRDSILNYCKYENLDYLPLPNAIKSYLSCTHAESS